METQTLDVKLSGMICPECEDEAASALLHTRGVISADVSYRKSAAVISYDAELTTPDKIAESLKSAGFPVRGSGKSSFTADLISVIAVLILAVLIPRLTGLVPVPEAEYGAKLGALFTVGLFTGIHCIGMCGGIMLIRSGTIDSGKRALAALLYNAGRVVSYTAMGAVCGTLGRAISYDAEFKSMFFTLCGILVTLIGLRMWGVPLLRRLHEDLALPCPLSGKISGKGGGAFVTGLLTGLMPCGALGAMWLLSASAGSAARGAASMLAFAAGTVPAMLLFGVLGAMIPKKYNKYILKTSTVLIVSLGLALAVKGLRMM